MFFNSESKCPTDIRTNVSLYNSKMILIILLSYFGANQKLQCWLTELYPYLTPKSVRLLLKLSYFYYVYILCLISQRTKITASKKFRCIFSFKIKIANPLFF